MGPDPRRNGPAHPNPRDPREAHEEVIAAPRPRLRLLPIAAAGIMSRGGVFLGVDVGTGSARAGLLPSKPLLSLFFLVY